MSAVAKKPTQDENGNYNDHGNLHQPGETLDSLVPRMLAHLERTFPGYKFSPARDTFAGGRSIKMSLISGPAGLTDREAGDRFLEKVRREMARFDRSQGNIYSDYHSCSFYADAKIDPRYHAEHAEVIEGTEVQSKMTLAAFKRTIKAGDKIILEATNSPYAQKNVGIEREIIKTRSQDFITAANAEGTGKVYCNYPSAKAFACDGERFRISDASEHDPNGFRLYRWIRS